MPLSTRYSTAFAFAPIHRDTVYNTTSRTILLLETDWNSNKTYHAGRNDFLARSITLTVENKTPGKETPSPTGSSLQYIVSYKHKNKYVTPAWSTVK